MPSKSYFVEFTLYLTAVLSIFSTGFLARNLMLSNSALRVDSVNYSYIGVDYSLEFPIHELDTVAMTLHESVHLVHDLTDEISNREWEAFIESPKSYGWARLGPERRLFLLAFHHELHCLYQMHLALVAPEPPLPTHHLQHCFNYMRQIFLCDAADMLEHGDFMQRDYARNRVGDDLMCQDWEKVYDVLDENYEQWLGWSSSGIDATFLLDYNVQNL